MNFIKMKISGLTVDSDFFFPLLILKSDKTKQSFPIPLEKNDKNNLMNALLNKNNVYSSVIQQIFIQKNMTIADVSIEESKNKLVSVVSTKHKNYYEKMFLSPLEGIMLAMEFGIDISLSEDLLKKKKYFRKTVGKEKMVENLETAFMDGMPFGQEGLKRKETIQ